MCCTLQNVKTILKKIPQNNKFGICYIYNTYREKPIFTEIVVYHKGTIVAQMGVLVSNPQPYLPT